MMKPLLFLTAFIVLSFSCTKGNQARSQLRDQPNEDISRDSSTLFFSGYTWRITNPNSLQEPGPNYWSRGNVWVDDSGFLNLRISKNPKTNRWECAQVVSEEDFGYGTYSWQVEGAIDELDKNVVLGLFNYSGNDGHDEMDIEFEFARWGIVHGLT